MPFFYLIFIIFSCFPVPLLFLKLWKTSPTIYLPLTIKPIQQLENSNDICKDPFVCFNMFMGNFSKYLFLILQFVLQEWFSGWDKVEMIVLASLSQTKGGDEKLTVHQLQIIELPCYHMIFIGQWVQCSEYSK